MREFLGWYIVPGSNYIPVTWNNQSVYDSQFCWSLQKTSTLYRSELLFSCTTISSRPSSGIGTLHHFTDFVHQEVQCTIRMLLLGRELLYLLFMTSLSSTQSTKLVPTLGLSTGLTPASPMWAWLQSSHLASKRDEKSLREKEILPREPRQLNMKTEYWYLALVTCNVLCEMSLLFGTRYPSWSGIMQYIFSERKASWNLLC